MAFNPISGKDGSVVINNGSDVEYAFGKWSVPMKAGLPKVNNFTSDFQQLVAGLTSGTINLEGPYDGGNMPLTVGTKYTFKLNFNGSIQLSVPAIVETVEPSQDVDDAARVKVTAQSTGSFTAAIV
jgi:hypothetical protein